MAAVGGAETHRLTVNELPKIDGYLVPASGTGISKGTTFAGFVSKIFGADFPHNNIPPYYTLAYIIKVV